MSRIAPHVKIVLATSNRGKLAEYRELFAMLPVELLTWSQIFGDRPQVAEDGATFQENALLKANAAAREAMMVTLAEDAGLEVDALGGRPGVRSARFAGEGATDAENNAALLAALTDVDDDQRTARFRCVLVLVDPWSEEPPKLTEGACEGRIARQASGSGGFGYDPLFVVAGHGRTMADLAEREKNAVSHRGRAAAAMRPHLESLIADRLRASAAVLSAGPPSSQLAPERRS